MDESASTTMASEYAGMSDFDRIMTEGRDRAQVVPVSAEPVKVKKRLTHEIALSEAGSLVVSLSWERVQNVTPASLNGQRGTQMGTVALDQVKGRDEISKLTRSLWRPEPKEVVYGREWKGLFPSSYDQWFDDSTGPEAGSKDNPLGKPVKKRASVPVSRAVRYVVPSDVLSKCGSQTKFVTHKGRGRQGETSAQAAFVAACLLDARIVVTSELIEAVMVHINGKAVPRMSIRNGLKAGGFEKVGVVPKLNRPIYGKPNQG